MLSYSSKNRLHYTLFIAIAAHALAVIALGFNWTQKNPAPTSIEVTLAQYKATLKLDDADFFAQIDQLGSGDGTQIKLLSSKDIAIRNHLNPTDIQESKQQSNTQATPTSGTKTTYLDADPTTNFDVIISNNSDYQLFTNASLTPPQKIFDKSQKSQLSDEIFTLNTQINLRSQKIAKAPKKRIISTMSTKSHQDAAYLENWRKRIVTVGNVHYPKAANEQKIYGRVRLLIAMQADGNIRSIEILATSGKQILDRAAIKIIRLAAPFEAFSPQMRKNTDILEIIRTIEFEKTTLLY
jgi:protein TonB